MNIAYQFCYDKISMTVSFKNYDMIMPLYELLIYLDVETVLQKGSKIKKKHIAL